MTRKNSLPSELSELAHRACAAHGVELVDVAFHREPGGAVLRVIIDKPLPGAPTQPGSAITVDECTDVSRELSALLDVAGDSLLPGAYRLEVSSPGVERPLVKLADFERFKGHRARVETLEQIGARKRFSGVLLGVEDDAIRIEQDGHAVTIPHDQIRKANLLYEL